MNAVSLTVPSPWKAIVCDPAVTVKVLVVYVA